MAHGVNRSNPSAPKLFRCPLQQLFADTETAMLRMHHRHRAMPDRLLGDSVREKFLDSKGRCADKLGSNPRKRYSARAISRFRDVFLHLKYLPLAQQ